MKGDNADEFIVSPACMAVINKGYTSFDDCPVWALLEKVEVVLLNEDVDPRFAEAADMVSAVRARLSRLTIEDTDQYNPVMLKSDWVAQKESE